MGAVIRSATFHIKCGRCGVIFVVHECVKLEHFSIYRADCPHCHWPGRYLASELHATPATQPLPLAPAASKVCR